MDLQDASESPPNPVTDAEEPSWLAKVTTKLDDLTSAVDSIQHDLADDHKRRRGSLIAWLAAAVLLAFSLILVFDGIHRGAESPTKAAAASRLADQAASLSSQLARTVRSEAPHCQGAPASAATLKCEIQTANISPSRYAAVVHDERWALLDLSSADRLEIEGPTVLAFGSALTGAVLGWMLAQGLGWRRRSRAERKSPDQESGTSSA